jgi:hypothetical protein
MSLEKWKKGLYMIQKRIEHTSLRTKHSKNLLLLTKKRSQANVEFALKLPGNEVWLFFLKGLSLMHSNKQTNRTIEFDLNITLGII